MRRFSLGLALAALPAFALPLMLAGCGGGKDSGPAAGSGGGGSVDQGEQKQELKVLNPGKGVLKGKILLRGSPNIEELTKNDREEMKKKDTEYCMKGSESETTEQAYRVGKENTLGNVFVWIIPDAGTFFKVEDKQLKALEKEVKIHQPHCAFVPHCAFLFSQYKPDPKKPRTLKPTGQILKIANDAEISHNTNWTGGSKNSGSNVILGKGTDRPVDNLVPEMKEVDIKCNIHPWMNGYLRVVDTPYYDISKSDTLDGKDKIVKDDPRFGTYEIKDLPAGKVRVLVWHEKCGYLNKDSGKGEVVEILPDKETEKNFEATAQ
ncbi:MAG TPA: hypothetical protein VMF69_02725 [Gemmataceae bacterium]|nr:hypothetical protein [Gemmataceae bacterium]